jgi:methyl-accepting chemotaxis protein
MIVKLTVAKRLTLGFGVFVLMLALAVFQGLSRLDALNEMTERMVSKDWQKTVLANDAIDLMNANARESFLLFHLAERKAAQQRMEANKLAITQKLAALDGMLYKPEGKALLADIRQRRTAYVAGFSKVAALLDAANEAEASQTMVGEVVPALDALLASCDKLIQFQGKILEETAQSAAAIYRSARVQMLAGLLLAVLAGVFLANWIIRSVIRPLGGEPDDVLRVVESIAHGDLTTAINVMPGDQHSLLAAMGRMQSSLKAMIGKLQHSAEGVASAAEQLATSSSQVAAATSAQAEAAAATASAVEQMTTSVTQVAERAHDAYSLTEKTGDLSQKGNGIIQQTVDEMQKVSQIVSEAASNIQAMGDKSQQISSIVQVIKDVADQTNLLALNAAIEAARAGEQGRGFAVVADEVRKLAERTAKATTEISNVIGAVQSSALTAVDTMQQAVSCVGQGVDLARQASDSMRGISGGAQSVVVMVTEISSALKEQSAASNEIAANVENIAQMSEENGAASHEVAETAMRLGMLAAQSRAAVSQFKVD